MSSSFDDETTLLVAVTTAPRVKEETTSTKNIIPCTTSFKCLAAILGMMAFATFLGGSSSGSGMVAVSAASTTTMSSILSTKQECPNKCQYTGEQATEWLDAHGRLCCKNHGIKDAICALNSPGNTCNCYDVADVAEANGHAELANTLREPCYIDTRCEPFQTWEDGTCKAKLGAQCDKYECAGRNRCQYSEGCWWHGGSGPCYSYCYDPSWQPWQTFPPPHLLHPIRIFGELLVLLRKRALASFVNGIDCTDHITSFCVVFLLQFNRWRMKTHVQSMNGSGN